MQKVSLPKGHRVVVCFLTLKHVSCCFLLLCANKRRLATFTFRNSPRGKCLMDEEDAAELLWLVKNG